MAAENIQDFTKKMLSEKVFICAICKNLLKIPVMMVENVGNVCHSCFEVQSTKHELKSVPNNTLSTVLKELKFSCKFNSEGCTEEIPYDNLQHHEGQCICRPVNCIMPKDECEWSGKLADLLNHFKEDHSKHILSGPYEQFSFEMNVQKVSSLVKILSHRHRTYILRIEKIVQDSSLLHFLQNITSSTEDFEMIVKYVGRNGAHKRKLEVLPFDVACDEQCGKKIKLSTIKEVSQENDTVKVVIKPENCKFNNINSEMAKRLECPVCKEIMRQPILQCLTGHSICQCCRKRLTECPTCRKQFSEVNIRNFSLEAVTPFVQYPCAYSQFGCISTFLGSEVDQHEAQCKYKMYECPKDDCNFAGNYMSCQQHCKVNHKGDLVTGTVYKSSFTPLGHRMTTTKQIVYFFAYGNIFELSFSRSADSCSWYIRLLSRYDKIVQYFFTVRVFDLHVTKRFIAKSNLCSDKDVYDTNNVISFTYDSLNSYKKASNDQMNFCCEIFAETSS